jgi:hypothetical protein
MSQPQQQPQSQLKRKSKPYTDRVFTDDYVQAKKIGIAKAEHDFKRGCIINNFNILTTPEYLDGFEDGYIAKIKDMYNKTLLTTREELPSDISHIISTESLETNLDILNSTDYQLSKKKKSKAFAFGYHPSASTNESIFTFRSSKATSAQETKEDSKEDRSAFETPINKTKRTM